MNAENKTEGIAVIGMACRFPGAQDTNAFWENLKNGVESITRFSDQELEEAGIPFEVYNRPEYVRKGFIIDDEDKFDASFFGYSPREAENMDPQHRLFLETAWKALEDGGYPPGEYDGAIGVFAGSKISTYLLNLINDRQSMYGAIAGYQTLIGNDKDYLVTRAAYKLNLKGPSVTVQSACSTSLVAVHFACESLLSGACDMALAGGVSVSTPQKTGYLYQDGMVISPDGHCRAFDEQAKGMIPGNGVGIVLLKDLGKALQDKDHIYAVIRGTAVNNDGSDKTGFTTPSMEGQAQVVREAISVAGVDCESISYIETHGTGTELGDPIEIEALNEVFKAETDKKGFCAIGSVKTNIGHLDTSAGVASLIKTALSLQHAQIPPSLNFSKPNPKIDFQSTPFFVNTQLSEWKTNGAPRRAGVSAFGFGGTNAHVVLEQAPQHLPEKENHTHPLHLLTLSAKTKETLKQQIRNYCLFLDNNEDLSIEDVCFTANTGRVHFQYRFAVISASIGDLKRQLSAAASGETSSTLFQGVADSQIEFEVSFDLSIQAVESDLSSGINSDPKVLKSHYRLPLPNDDKDVCLSVLSALAKLFVQGAAIDWGVYYHDDTPHRIQLPTYPFEGKRHWQKKIQSLKENTGAMPFMGQQLSCATPVFQFEISIFAYPFLKNHRIHGKIVIPVGVFWEMLLASGKTYFKTNRILLKNMTQHEAMLISEENPSLKVQILLNPGDSGNQDAGFIIFCKETSSDQSPENWKKYVSGDIAVKGVLGETLSLEGARTGCKYVYDVSKFTSDLHALDNFTGDVSQNSWQFEEIRTGDHEALAKIVFPDSFLSETDNCQLHPSIFEPCLQTLLAIPLRQKDNVIKDKVFLPIGFDSIHCTSKICQEVWCHATIRPGKNWRDIDFIADFQIATKHGEAIAQMSGAYMRQASTSTLLRDKVKSPCYRIQWQKVDKIDLSQNLSKSSSPGCWLILGDRDGVAEKLAQCIQADGGAWVMIDQDGNLHTNHPGYKFKEKIPVDPIPTQETFELILEKKLPEHGLHCNGVVQCWGINPPTLEDWTAEKLINCIFSAYSTTVHLLRAIVSSAHQIDDFCLLTQGAQAIAETDLMSVVQTPLWGMQKCLVKEHPELNIHIFDTDRSGHSPGQLKSLWQMLRFGAVERQIAFRNKSLYVPRLMPLGSSHDSLQVFENNLCLNSAATYLITGGFGGLGLETAVWMAEHGAKHLMLIGRNNPSSSAQKKIYALQTQGVQILTKKADVSDFKVLSKAISGMRKSMPPLKGLFHLAGILGQGDMLRQNLDRAKDIMAPKVEGAWNLHRITRQDSLDFFVLFSSISSLWGGHGLGAYAAANSFLDALAHYRKEIGLPGLSINWGAFSEVGMTAKDQKGAWLRKKFGVESLSPQKALANFIRVQKFTQACISEMDWNRFFTQPDMKNDPLFSVVLAGQQKNKSRQGTDSDLLAQLPMLPDEKRYERLQNYLFRKVADALGVDADSISMHDDLLQMGMDSLIFLSLAQTIGNDLHIKIVPHKLFANPTIEGLLTQIAGEIRSESPAKEELDATFAVKHDPVNRHEPFDLTDIQHAYWVGRSGVTELGDIACHVYFEIDTEELDIDRYTASWQKMIERHEMLRAIILPDGRQQVLETVPPFQIPTKDLRGESSDIVARQIAVIREKMSHQVRPENQWPLFEVRATLLDNKHILLHLSIDILIADGFSLFNLMQEIMHYYRTPEVKLVPITCTFRDYMLAERAFRESKIYQQSRQYWIDRLPSLPPPPELPLAKKPSELKKTRFVRREIRLDKNHWERLQSYASEAGLTRANVLLAAYAEVLATWSKSQTFTLNLTFFHRLQGHPQINEVIGDFTSLVLLKTNVSHDIPFNERARQIQDQLWKDMEYRHFSGIRVLQELSRKNQGTARTLMPVVFTSNLGYETIRQERSGLALPGQIVYSISQTPQVWIDNQVAEDDKGLIIFWDAVEELFPVGMLDDMFHAYHSLLTRLSDSDDTWCAKTFNLLPDCQAAMRKTFNATQAPISDQMLHTLFFDQADRTPDKTALITTQKRMNYKELSLWAKLIGQGLRTRDIRPNELAAVVMDKGWEQIPAVLGIMYSGAAYLPIDPSVPKGRLRHLLKDGQVRYVLTQSWLARELEWPDDVECLSVDTVTLEDAEKRTGPQFVQTCEDLAYVIHTSGSTGLPKGVMSDHKGAVNTILDINKRFHVTSEDTIFALSNLNFDLSVYDIFGMLAAGGTVVIPDESLRKDPAHWLSLMKQEHVTIWNSVPALMQMLLEYASGSNEPGTDALRLVLLSGDWIPVELPDKVRTICEEAKIISLGGATEAAIWSILYPINHVDPQWKSIPYGHPMTNQSVYVLNKNMEICPDWVTGDLYIGGIGLAKGYWQDKEKTKGSFILDTESGIPLYRTGDMGRFLPNGNIEFLGREDQQVKINGYRIELGEIETVLANHPGVQDAVVAAQVTGDGKQQLVGYVVPKANTSSPANRQSELEAIHGKEVKLVDPVARVEFKMARKGVRAGAKSVETISLLPSPMDQDLIGAFSQRISYRRFDQDLLRFEQFARFMETLRSIRIPEYPFPRYRYGSAGGLYPVQIYVQVKPQRISSISPGISYYHPEKHQLELLTPDSEIPHSVYKGNEDIYEEAAFAVFLIANKDAIEPLYGSQSKAYCLMEAGIISHLLESTAFSFGIGLCQIGGLDFSKIRHLFQLDPGHEYLHCLVGGKITQARDWTLLDAIPHQSIPSWEGKKRMDATVLDEIRTVLAETLPAYMVPHQFMILDHIPLTSNGKVARQQLPAPVLEKKRSRAPASPLEKEVAKIWCQVLCLESVGVEEHFFESGGDSLVAVKLVNRLRERFDISFPLKRLLEKPTIAHVANLIEEEISVGNHKIFEYEEGTI